MELSNCASTCPTAETPVRALFDLLAGYDEYIKCFEWNNNKYSYKRSLPELTGIITKKMKDHDELLKKHQEEQSTIKNQLAGYMKKEGGNLMVRDFTDDIYSQNAPKDWFVESLGSEMFTNLLVVVHKSKEVTFPQESTLMMREYYDAQDALEDKRVPDQAKIRLADLKEKQEEFDKFVQEAKLVDSVNSESFDEKAKQHIEVIIKKELEVKRRHRLTEAIAPEAFKALGLEDKEGNKVFRMVVLKS